jgi:hypothetical protein
MRRQMGLHRQGQVVNGGIRHACSPCYSGNSVTGFSRGTNGWICAETSLKNKHVLPDRQLIQNNLPGARPAKRATTVAARHTSFE